MKELVKKYREDLHKIPELCLKEYKTKQYLVDTLTAMGYSPFSVLETDVLVYIDNNHDSTVAFRADMDGLPIKENTNLSFKSTHENNMHACGHDGHMAMLLSLANYLKDKTESLKKNILLIFQPAEESVGGARLLVQKGILKNHNVEAIFGIHLFPELEQGVLGSKPNEFMAMANEIDITIYGKTAHGAMPQDGIDSNIIMSKMLIDFQNIQTRLTSPLEYTIITFGRLEGGSVRNVISDKAVMEGTIRAFNLDVFKNMIDNIYKIAKGYETIYDCKIDIDMKPGYLPVINNESIYPKFKKAIKKFNYFEFPKPFMIAEDFSFYQNEVPGIFFFLGIKNEKLGYNKPLHSSEFNFDVNVLLVGLDAYISIMEEFEIL